MAEEPRIEGTTGWTVRRQRWIACAVIVLACFVVYARGLRGPLFFDDGSIINNPYIRTLDPTVSAFQSTPHNVMGVRPVVSYSAAINYALGELDPLGYRIFNLVVHIINALLLFALLDFVLSLDRFATRFGRQATAVAFACAMIWAVHPLASEPVLYVIQRTESMMAMFYLLTLYLSVRGMTSPDGAKWPWYAGAIVACLLGMGSKEVMVSAPLAVLLLDRAVVSNGFAAAMRRHWPLYAGLAATWIALAILIARVPPSESMGFGFNVTPLDYLRTQAVVIVWYLRLCLWPAPLAVTHDFPVVESLADCWPHGLFILALIAATVVALVRKPAVGLLGACFFMILAPSSSFIPIVTEFAAERRMYLPLATVVVLVVTGAYALGSRLIERRSIAVDTVRGAQGVIAALVILALAVTAFVRAGDYRDEATIWRDVLSKFPNSPYGNLGMGTVLLHQNPAAAEKHLAVAVRTRPNLSPAHTQMGIAMAMQGKLDGALLHFQRAVELEPTWPEPRMNLGIALAQSGRDAEAMRELNEAVRLSPDLAAAHFHLGVLHMRAGRVEVARHHLLEARRLGPSGAAEVEKLLTQLEAPSTRPAP